MTLNLDLDLLTVWPNSDICTDVQHLLTAFHCSRENKKRYERTNELEPSEYILTAGKKRKLVCMRLWTPTPGTKFEIP